MLYSNVICVYFEVPKAYEKRVRQTLSEVATRMGIPFRLTADPSDADIVYTAHNLRTEYQALFIPFDEDLYNPFSICEDVMLDGKRCWKTSKAPDDRIDLIGGIWRLLYLLDEQQVSRNSRNRLGIFNTDALPSSRLDTIQIPLVEEMVDLVFRAVISNRPQLLNTRLPFWPHGKSWVFLLTQDVDSLNLGDWKEISFNLVKLALRRKSVYWFMFQSGIRTRRNQATNPHYSFFKWHEWLSERGLRSTFYFFIQPRGVPRALHDCRTSIDNQDMDYSALIQLLSENYEIGLHASIRSKESVQSLSDAKQWLESHLNTVVEGVRHHYLSTDWYSPSITWSKQASAGFAYDTSCAYRDTGGFRAGTCFPFRTYDCDNDTPIDMFEIPFCLMDSHLAELKGGLYDPDELGIETSTAIAMLNDVKRRNGIVHLDWHQESFWDLGTSAGYRERLALILDALSPDSSCWVATPREVIRYWRERYNACALSECE